MKVLDLMVDFIKMSKVWCLVFYGAWQEAKLLCAIHKDQTLDIFMKIAQNVHTADLVYLGFQDYLLKFAAP